MDMRFAVISDIHGNLAALQRILSDLEALESPVEVIVSTGDIVGHCPHPNEVIDLLRERDVEMVRGNYDEAVVGSRVSTGADYASRREQALDEAAVLWTRKRLTPENLEFLAGLPLDTRLRVSPSGRTAAKVRQTDDAVSEYRKNFFLGSLFGGAATQGPRMTRNRDARRVLFVHASPRDVVEYIYPGTARSILQTIAADADADVIVFGHGHLAFHEVVGGVALIGVGSAGRSRTGGTAEYGLIEITGAEIDVEFRNISYDVDREIRDLRSSGLPHEMADVLRHGSFPARQPAS